jgi:hypothetical protein
MAEANGTPDTNTPAPTGGDDQYGTATDADIAFAESAGWRPREEYDGPEGTWEPADVFATKARQINRVLNKSNESLRKEIQELKTGNAEFAEHLRKQHERELDIQIKALRAERAVAVTDGDSERFDKADSEIDKLEKERDKAPAKAPEVDAATVTILKDWGAANPWYGTDDEKTALATVVANRMRKEVPELISRTAEWLEELDKRLLKAYPERFAKRRSSSARTENGSGGGTAMNGRGRTFENLPQDAKDACDRFFKSGYLGKDQKKARETYASNYDWDAK